MSGDYVEFPASVVSGGLGAIEPTKFVEASDANLAAIRRAAETDPAFTGTAAEQLAAIRTAEAQEASVVAAYAEHIAIRNLEAQEAQARLRSRAVYLDPVVWSEFDFATRRELGCWKITGDYGSPGMGALDEVRRDQERARVHVVHVDLSTIKDRNWLISSTDYVPPKGSPTDLLLNGSPDYKCRHCGKPDHGILLCAEYCGRGPAMEALDDVRGDQERARVLLEASEGSLVRAGTDPDGPLMPLKPTKPEPREERPYVPVNALSRDW